MHGVRAGEALAGVLLILPLQLKYALRGLQKLPAVLSKHKGAAADEQRGVQLLLKLRYLLAQRLLRYEQVLRRLRKALLLGNGYKAFEYRKIHFHSPTAGFLRSGGLFHPFSGRVYHSACQ